METHESECETCKPVKVEVGDLVYDDFGYQYRDNSLIGLVIRAGLMVDGVDVLWCDGKVEAWDYETFCLYHTIVKSHEDR